MAEISTRGLLLQIIRPPVRDILPAADAESTWKAANAAGKNLDGATTYANNGIVNSKAQDEETEEVVKPVFGVASCKDDLRGFPEEVKDVMGFALYQAQKGEKHVAAKPLKGFGGAGVLEIVEDHAAGARPLSARRSC
jgi:hypothetical protein